MARIGGQKGSNLDPVNVWKVGQVAPNARNERRGAVTLSSCGTVRNDDKPDTFARRLEEYRRKTAPLLNYYRRRGELTEIDGMRDMDGVTGDIASVLTKIASD